MMRMMRIMRKTMRMRIMVIFITINIMMIIVIDTMIINIVLKIMNIMTTRQDNYNGSIVGFSNTDQQNLIEPKSILKHREGNYELSR